MNNGVLRSYRSAIMKMTVLTGFRLVVEVPPRYNIRVGNLNLRWIGLSIFRDNINFSQFARDYYSIRINGTQRYTRDDLSPIYKDCNYLVNRLDRKMHLYTCVCVCTWLVNSVKGNEARYVSGLTLKASCGTCGKFKAFAFNAIRSPYKRTV